MATKSSKYWQGRFDQVEQSANNKTVKYTKQLEKKYKTAASQIDAQINKWYNRIAKNNEVSMTEARRLLSRSELAEFRWDVQQYIEAGQQNAIDQRWMKELENASAKFHINRLEAMKLEVRQQIEVALADGQQSMYDTLADVYKDTFYRSCFEIQKGVGVGFDVSALDDGQVSKLLNKPWSVDGENFSSKVWKNKTKLINNLDQELTRMVLTGSSPQKAIQNIKKSMNTSLYNAKRLVLTEQAYFCTLGQKDAFGELDVEEYEIVATLDGKTSEICQEQDGKHYPVKEMQVGVNAPPFHVFCRSTTCPYFDDEFTINDKRVAKGEDDEWYEVPASMKYPEWKQTFVDGGSKADLTPITSEKQIEEIIADVPTSVERTIADINTEATDALLDAYDDRRTHFGLNLVSADDLRKSDLNSVTVNYDGVSLETAEAFDSTIQALSDEYYTGFTKIEVGDAKDFFGVPVFATTQHNNIVGQRTLVLNPIKTKDYDKMTDRIKQLSDKGYAVKIADGLEGQYIPTHEFAHSLIDFSGNYKNYVGMDVKQMKGIKKEIDSLFDDYKNEVSALESAFKEKELEFLNASISLDVDMDELSKIQKEAIEAREALEAVKISKYSLENADEFMAEAFTQSKIGVSQGKYSDKVMNVIDKHFKKEVIDDVADSLGSGENGIVNLIKQADIDNVSLINVPNLNDDKLSTLQDAHKRVLQVAKDSNDSMEVALMLDEDMNDISTILGTATEIDLNVPGRTKAAYVIHNHPNNESFSDIDLAWFVKNDNTKYFSIAKNNGSVELLHKPIEFDSNLFKIEYQRAVKKYQKDIEKNAQKGYNKAVEYVLTKTKSGLIYVR